MSTEIDLPPDIIKRYIERRKQDFKDCEKALENKNYEVLVRLGHQIKGNAPSYGFNELGAIAIDLEAFALTKDDAQLAQVLRKFSSCVAQLKVLQ